MPLPRLVGICGEAGSGKDTLARFLCLHGNYQQAGLADPMKEFCAKIFGWDYERLWGSSDKRELPDPKWGGLTARHALQTLGTEWGRNQCHQDIWIRYATRDTVRSRIFTDLRFKNEIEAFKASGAHLIRIRRPGVGGTSTHQSEAEQREIPDAAFHTIINNDSSLDDLQHQARRWIRSMEGNWTESL